LSGIFFAHFTWTLFSRSLYLRFFESISPLNFQSNFAVILQNGSNYRKPRHICA
jgi:hypothetical protein